ncbi:MAG: VWA domain-containing protein [Patulibacter sp.]|nr:VWA domain-containing protein [Patulibacter sp.]
MTHYQGDESIVSPFLFIIDTSGSMGPHPDATPEQATNTPIAALNAKLPQVIYSLQNDPEVAELCCLGMITFSSTASEVFPIRPLGEAPDPLPSVNAFGTTNYADAFRLARKVIARDVPQLGASGRRPLILFITDGQPYHKQDPDWQTPLAELRDPTFHLHPKIAVLGFGDANRSTMEQIASSPNFVRMWDSENPSQVVISILNVIQRTIISMTRAGVAASSQTTDLADALMSEAIDNEPANWTIEYDAADL